MSVRVMVDVTGLTAGDLAELRAELENPADLHAKIARDAEAFVKAHGESEHPKRHATANRLGAQPTKHLEKAYADIQRESDAGSARLLVPRASRLRAAFGQYVLTPGPGKKYLTLPAAREAYGKRAGEFGEELEFARVGPRQTPVLFRELEGRGAIDMEVMYVLIEDAEIQEDLDLIPFDELAEEAVESAQGYLDELVEDFLA